VPSDTPPSARPTARHGAPSREFDGGFWRQLLAGKRRVHAVADTLAAANDREAASLDERLAALENRHRDAMAQASARPLPRRTPGASLAAARELATA
jgi:hypothetical protein